MSFTIFDIIIFATISLSAILGLYRGMLNITINLLGFIASIIVAIILFPYINTFLENYIERPLMVSIVSGIIAYIISLTIFTIITNKIVAVSGVINRGFLDQLLGFCFGIFRGLVVAILIFAILAVFSSGVYVKSRNLEDIKDNLNAEKYPEYLMNSNSTEYLENLFKTSILLLPQDVIEYNFLPKSKVNEEIIIEEIEDEFEEQTSF